MKFDLENRHIIVTGGAGSLGTEVVQLLLDAGAFCSVPCLSKDEQNSFDLTGNRRVFSNANIDLTSEEQTQSFYEEATNEHGKLWGSVHVAGGFGMGKIEDTPLADFNKQLQMNTVTCYNSCRAAVEWMRKSDYAGGRIVNVASRPALEQRQGKGRIAYTVSKAGVVALTESLGEEVIQDDILVNAIAPSIIDTPQNRSAMPDANYEKWPNPEQLARQIAYLVSPANEVTRGDVIKVYGKS